VGEVKSSGALSCSAAYAFISSA